MLASLLGMASVHSPLRAWSTWSCVVDMTYHTMLNLGLARVGHYFSSPRPDELVHGLEPNWVILRFSCATSGEMVFPGWTCVASSLLVSWKPMPW